MFRKYFQQLIKSKNLLGTFLTGKSRLKKDFHYNILQIHILMVF